MNKTFEQKFKLAFGLFVIVFGTWLLFYQYMGPAVDVLEGNPAKSTGGPGSERISKADRDFLDHNPMIPDAHANWWDDGSISPAAYEAADRFREIFPGSGKPTPSAYQENYTGGRSWGVPTPESIEALHSKVNQSAPPKYDAPIDSNYSMPQKKECNWCSGSGTCTWCRGTGGSKHYNHTLGKVVFESDKQCNGTGRCQHCGGSGKP